MARGLQRSCESHGEKPQRPADVGDRDDGSGELPPARFVVPDELKGTEGE
jgi:hypothetical protein